MMNFNNFEKKLFLLLKIPTRISFYNCKEFVFPINRIYTFKPLFVPDIRSAFFITLSSWKKSQFNNTRLSCSTETCMFSFFETLMYFSFLNIKLMIYLKQKLVWKSEKNDLCTPSRSLQPTFVDFETLCKCLFICNRTFYNTESHYKFSRS